MQQFRLNGSIKVKSKFCNSNIPFEPKRNSISLCMFIVALGIFARDAEGKAFHNVLPFVDYNLFAGNKFHRTADCWRLTLFTFIKLPKYVVVLL